MEPNSNFKQHENVKCESLAEEKHTSYAEKMVSEGMFLI